MSRLSRALPKTLWGKRALGAVTIVLAIVLLYVGYQVKRAADGGWMNETEAYQVAEDLIAETVAGLTDNPGFDVRERHSTICNEGGFAPADRASAVIRYWFAEVPEAEVDAFNQATLARVHQLWADAGYPTVVDRPGSRNSGFTFVVDADRGFQLKLEAGVRMIITAKSGCASRTDNKPWIKPQNGGVDV